MSTLNVQTLTDGVKSMPTHRALEGTFAVHATLTSAAAIWHSYNVAATTDHGTGNHSVFLTNAIIGTNDATGMASAYSGSSAISCIRNIPSTTEYAVRSWTDAGALFDRFTFTGLMGDLA